jgi:signal recognition particle subunit SEC65
MGTKATGTGAGELAEAKRGFDQWRRSRRRGREIPEPLWRMAVKAAASHGVWATARRLGLNATRLKQWAQRLAPVDAEQNQRFVELPWLGAAPIPECVLEAEDQAGRKLRIHLKGPATAQAAALGRLLWTGEQ